MSNTTSATATQGSHHMRCDRLRKGLVTGGGEAGRELPDFSPTELQHNDVSTRALGQHDSELLLSYLTVPYLRIPLVVSFFASEDRIHLLQFPKLQALLDAVLFEPGA